MTTRRATTLFAFALIASTLFAAPSRRPETTDAAFPIRMVKMAGEAGRAATRAHVEYCAGLGFNALWVYSHEAGVWSKQQAPTRPIVDPAFLRLARWCRRHGIEVWISINPVEDSRGRFVFSDPEGERRILSFISMLQEQAGVRRFVLSFDDQPRELSELADVFRYGPSAARAHLDLVTRVAARLPSGTALWLCGSAYCDAHLGDGNGPYAKAFLAGLPSVPPEVGIVWTGPTVISPSISRADLVATRSRLGGRKLLLYDNFPTNDNGYDDAMALILGALRNRDPGIRHEIEAYLSCPGLPLAGSRLSLQTVASFLSDPDRYDPDAAARDAIARLAGDDKEAADALTTQQLEWGGFIGELNYWPRELLHPTLAGKRLHDPAFVDSFTWTVARYPGRMAALARIDDAPFREVLLRMMRRRLAVGRAMPLAIEYAERVRRGSADAAETLAKIEAERRLWRRDHDARMALERFLLQTGLPAEWPRR